MPINTSAQSTKVPMTRGSNQQIARATSPRKGDFHGGGDLDQRAGEGKKTEGENLSKRGGLKEGGELKGDQLL